MPFRKSATISPELFEVAEGLLATGRYGNISDVMRTALRFLEERELGFQGPRDAMKAQPRPSITKQMAEV